jgi:branched-chain amino acid transport system ATP-binding protein
MPLLQVTDLARHFGGVKALDGVSMQVESGDVVGLVGPNGSGKTTLVNTVTGYLRATSGTVELDGTPVTNSKPNRLAALGVGRTYQVPRLFESLTVVQNVMAALLFSKTKPSFWRGLVPMLDRRGQDDLRGTALAALERVDMAHLADRPASSVSLGEARRAEIARALVAAQRLLVLDEPAAGLRGTEAMDIGKLVAEIAKREDVGVLLIDHNVALVRAFCSHLVVLDFGRVIAAGQPDEVVRRREVVEAYLGPGHGPGNGNRNGTISPAPEG